jgi:hypothetical protein
MTSMLNDRTLEALLERLHAQSRGQGLDLDEHFSLLSRTNREQPEVASAWSVRDGTSAAKQRYLNVTADLARSARL